MAAKKVKFINLNNQILALGGDGIMSFPDIATMASEPIATLKNGAISWVDSEQKYYQFLDTNTITESGYWKELIFGSDFQISDPTTSADDDRYKGKVVQYIGEDDLATGFRKGYFYESRIETTLTYIETVCTETTTGIYYILRDGEYLEVILTGDGTTFDPDETYFKKQDTSIFGWFYINALRVDTDLADTDYAIANKTVKAKFEEVQEYIDNDLTTALQQYADDKIDDTDEEVFEDKSWSSSKTKDYVDTTVEGYEKKFVELTFAEYKALDEAGEVEADVDYIITSSDESGISWGKFLLEGSDIGYNNSASGIDATNIQGAIDKVVENINEVSENVESALKTSKDVEPTDITFNGDGTYFDLGGGNHKYEIKNGVCYFQVYVQTKGSTTTTMKPIANLPKPKYEKNFNVAPYVWSNDKYTPLRASINNNGVLQACMGSTWYSYFIEGSYPVAD